MQVVRIFTDMSISPSLSPAVIYFDGIGSEEEPDTVTISSSGQGLHFSTSHQRCLRPRLEWESRGDAEAGGAGEPAPARGEAAPGEGPQARRGWGRDSIWGVGFHLSREASFISQPFKRSEERRVGKECRL